MNECLLPTLIPDCVSPVPDAVLEMIKCNCASESPCSRQNCTCSSAKLSCNKFCKCYESSCFNVWTKTDDDDLSENEEDENGEDDDTTNVED